MRLQDKFRELEKQQRGLLATNFYNYETLAGILLAASAVGQPLILQLTRSSIEYMGLNMAVNMARTALRDYNVEGWLHLDHGDSIDLVRRCLDAGFDSVMIDASERSFAENISITREVVKLAEKYDANVEAELGYVAKLGQSHESSGFTQPEEAKKFVEETQIHALAVAIGTVHGFYKTEPALQLDILTEIHKVTSATLVLHGGSGVPHSILVETIKRGICKINLATEIKNIFMSALKEKLTGSDEIDLRKIFPSAISAVSDLVGEKLKVVSMS
jgi:ketose-bisphosphate aldolase